MRWQDPLNRLRTSLPGLPLIAALFILTACSSGEQGMMCQGEVQTLSGRTLSKVEGKIVDRYASFSVTLPDLKLESGLLHSADRRLYVPSAVTRDGWLAMRLSDTRFMVVNAPQDKVVMLNCPARSI